MRIPLSPPDLAHLMVNVGTERLPEILTARGGPTVNGKYLHWDELRHRAPPEGLDHDDWWLAISLSRRSLSNPVPLLLDKKQKPFQYAVPDTVHKLLHEIDSQGRGHIAMPDPIANKDQRDRYIVSSLIEEAITSSQLEGASTTRRVAEDMLRSGRAPGDRSERMIANNYLAMNEIRKMADHELSIDALLSLHKIIARDTMDVSDDEGRFQQPGETRVSVLDNRDGTTLHMPPPAEELPERMARLVEFANNNGNDRFIHPVIKAVILHFWIGYDHPFSDGNGRTARALFYWYLLRHGYWLFEFLSISTVIRKAPAQYARAYLYTETDSNDLTYFLIHQLEIVMQSIASLNQYIERKVASIAAAEAQFRNTHELNYRQLAVISHALRHPNARYTIKSHQTSHDIVNATARTDLLDLVDGGFLEKKKMGREFVFYPHPDIAQRR